MLKIQLGLIKVNKHVIRQEGHSELNPWLCGTKIVWRRLLQTTGLVHIEIECEFHQQRTAAESHTINFRTDNNKKSLTKMVSSWLKVSILLCMFGFLRELRPSEPFAVEFFINYRNISNDELTNYYFPLGTYSYMVQLVVVFLITDIMR